MAIKSQKKPATAKAQRESKNPANLSHTSVSSGAGKASIPPADDDLKIIESLQITYLPTAGLFPHEKNARKHPKKQLAQLKRSIQEFGFLDPCGIDKSGRVWTGAGRLVIAKELNMATVPTVDLSHLTPDQLRKYCIAHNKIALNAEWDDDVLKMEVLELQEMGHDLTVLAFSPEELPDVLKLPSMDLSPGGGGISNPAQITSKLGDVWHLGDTQLQVGLNNADADFLVSAWEKRTGEKAKHDNGQTFSEIRKERLAN